jgi:hypothetical protein
MVAANVREGLFEDQLAELTTAAYHVALRHGLRAPFIDVELELWRALRQVLSAPSPSDAPEIVRWASRTSL